MVINIHKITNLVVDINQSYDARFYDNSEYPDGTIPANESPQLYKRLIDLTIAKKTQQEIESINEMELKKRIRTEFLSARSQLLADIAALPASPQKQILITLLQTLRLFAQLVKLE